MYELLLVTFLSLITPRHATAVFVHDSSPITIHPSVQLNHSDFGFAMGFQVTRNNLVVGAPSVDIQGKVYSCDMNSAGDVKDISCEENPIDPDFFPKYIKDQHFYTGASIAATPNNFLTCAPLRTLIFKHKHGPIPDAIGTCFIFKQGNKKPHMFSGTYEQYRKEEINGRRTNKIPATIYGGTGWTTLADEDNGLFIISKTSLQGDIIYTSTKTFLDNTKSMVLSPGLKFKVDKFYNFGYGVTSGKFFSNSTMYAFSMTTKSMSGIVEFLQYNPKSKRLYTINRKASIGEFTIDSKKVGTMFGAVLAAADLNMDGFDDLLVAAPVYTEEDCVECGALHIYLGGEMATINENARIIGAKEFGRFSTAIVARDIDGDSIPELVVSAPYENDGMGAIYIFSGYEMRSKLRLFEHYIQLQPWDLKYTQRIQKDTFRTLGYSLQFIHDTDNNGCSELVAGSPGNGTAVLFKTVQTINVTLSCSLIGAQIVREQDANFTVKVCATIQYPKLPTDIYGDLTVTNSIIGDGTDLQNPSFNISISCVNCPKNKTECANATVDLKDKEPRDYTFKSEAKLQTDYMLNSTEFYNAWVITSPHYSKLNERIEISRHCSGNDCIPQLSMELLWSGRTDQPYVLGSTSSETATIRVSNVGNNSYEACVWVRVNGAPLSQVSCGDYDDAYRCYLPKPLRRDTEHSITLVLNMTKLTNMDKKLVVEARLYENCNQESSINGTSNITISYVVPTERVYVEGISHSRNFTEKEIIGDDSSSITDDQVFLIWNNGSTMWKNVVAKIFMKKKPFVNSFMVSADKKECKEDHTDDTFNLICNLNLMPNATQKIIATAIILKSDISNNLEDGQFNTTSEIALFLHPTKVIKQTNVTTVMTFMKELTWANNIWFIAVIAGLIALLVLVIIIGILLKCGFFKRKQKQRLHVFRESLKVRNSRRNTHVSSVADGQGIIDMDVVEDPFEDIPIPPNTVCDIVMTEEKVNGHGCL